MWELVDDAFDFGRVHVGSAPQDQGLVAILYVEMAIGIDEPHIAGVQYPAAESTGTGLLVPPVAQHQVIEGRDVGIVRGADADLT